MAHLSNRLIDNIIWVSFG